MKNSIHWLCGAGVAVPLVAAVWLNGCLVGSLAMVALALASALWWQYRWRRSYPATWRTRMEVFDWVISGGIGKQLICFTIVTMAVVALYILIATWTQRDLSLGARVWWVILRFIDPGQAAEERLPDFGLLLPVLIALTGMVLLTGLLITTLSNIVERRVDSVKNGLAVYRNVGDHYVIIGYGEISISLIKSIFERHGWRGQLADATTRRQRRALRAAVDALPKILILTDQPIAAVRAEIRSQLPNRIEHKIIFYAGNIESYEHLASLNIDRAREVYVLGERNEYGRDTKNLACVKTLSALRGDRPPLLVHVQFDRMPSFSAIQKLALPSSYTYTYCKSASQEQPNIYFRPFNFHENWARLLWCFYARDPEPDGSDAPAGSPQEEGASQRPGGGSPEPSSLKFDSLNFRRMGPDDHVHLVIVGFNRMGRALLLEALRICHYANYDEKNDRTRTRITVVDPDMERLQPFFRSQYPYLEQIDDVEIDFRGVQAEQTQLRDEIRRWACDGDTLLTVAVCLQDPDMSLAIGLNLPEEVYYQRGVAQQRLPRVLVRQELQCGLGELLSENRGRFANVRIFGMLSQCIHPQLFDDLIPSLLHGDYESGTKTAGKKMIETLYAAAAERSESVFRAQLAKAAAAWNALQENMRWANRYQMDIYPSIIATLRRKGIDSAAQIGPFDAAHPRPVDERGEPRPVLDDATLETCARMEHRRWVAERTISGWRQARAGEVRENMFQIHTAIIPYTNHTQEEKEKDRVVILNVLKLMFITQYYNELKTRDDSSRTDRCL